MNKTDAVGWCYTSSFLIDSKMILIVLKPYMGGFPSIYLTSSTFDCQMLVKQLISTKFSSGLIETFQIRPVNKQMLLILRF